ncbi:acetate--CoA ligase family protein [Desulfitobacterium chlororespirans]|uniref:Acyl-CoA synthetase (NDP forming) n=1 Tax=Desulfitobacterium chlororespirans DSM 11544 TaxID=1121395 RepID=A0A1M7UG05_9FIRM|nr:acetate--CoA ligase family protein [Desulfitobacterium chlororespirans]SHN81918.1 Acyl-CoA synthetase (NDP forming) [Desulfitobacterium chlororespirans DSM 11544]
MSLKKLFYPKTIAIVGASQNLDSIGGQPIKFLKKYNFQGTVMPVNPKYSEIAGLKCYPSVSSITEEIDVVLVSVAASRVLPIVKECVEKKAHFVVIFSSGFAEMGNHQGQQELIDAVAGTGTRILGPNNQGIVNFIDGIPAGFNPLLDAEVIPKGNIGIVAQSSGLGFAAIGFAIQQRLGISHIATVGNQADINIMELIQFMIEDEHTSIITCIVEGLKPSSNLPELAKLAKQKGKSLVFLKLGRTAVGKKASMSHSGSLAGDSDIFEAFCKQAGIISVKDMEDLIDVLIGLQGKKPGGDRVAVVTETGGSGILAADICEDFHIQTPRLTEETINSLNAILPDFASAQNPVDFTAHIFNQEDLFRNCLVEVVKDSNIDVLLFSFGPTRGKLAEKMADDIIEISKELNKSIFISWLTPEQPFFNKLREANVPLYPTPYRCIRALEHIVRQEIPVKAAEKKATADKKHGDAEVLSLTEYQTKKMLGEYGIAVLRGGLATSLEEAVNLGSQIDYPVVLKVMSPQIAHKTDAGLVILGIKNEQELTDNYNTILERAKKSFPTAAIEGVLVEKMVEKPVAEVILGIKYDITFGPVIIFGLGGIFVEVLGDVARRVLPLTREEALAMLASIKAYPLLNGYRGKPQGNLDALVDMILNLSRFAIEQQDNFKEMDINPVFVMPEGQGVICGDALLIPR